MNPPPYGTKVKVCGVDEQGIKELFDDFIGEFVSVCEKPRYGRDAEWRISGEGVGLVAVHPSQVTLYTEPS